MMWAVHNKDKTDFRTDSRWTTKRKAIRIFIEIAGGTWARWKREGYVCKEIVVLDKADHDALTMNATEIAAKHDEKYERQEACPLSGKKCEYLSEYEVDDIQGCVDLCIHDDAKTHALIGPRMPGKCPITNHGEVE